MKRLIDLHVHSNFSDGSYSPTEIAKVAKDINLRAIALTDHDRVDGLLEITKELEGSSVELVPGLEISAQASFGADDTGTLNTGTLNTGTLNTGTLNTDINKRALNHIDEATDVFKRSSCHVLLYFVDPNSDYLLHITEGLLNDRVTRNDRLIAKLNSIGINIDLEYVKQIAGNDGVGRPHFAKALVEKKYVTSVEEAFDNYLGSSGKAYIPKARLTLTDCVKLANESGGVAVLAHPMTISENLDLLEEFFFKLSGLGFVGIEAYYGRYSIKERSTLADLAHNSNLVATGGSDFHGSYKPDLEIGYGTGDLKVDDSILDQLKAKL